jgi:hypothetical protein
MPIVTVVVSVGKSGHVPLTPLSMHVPAVDEYAAVALMLSVGVTTSWFVPLGTCVW